jgi:polysaccharide biosynthesis protein PslH
VPMRMGGGTRLKVLEAMAMGAPVLATPLGCEGYGLVDGEHVAIADGAEAFAARASQLLHDADARRALGERGREFVSARYDWSRIVPLLVDAYGS